MASDLETRVDEIAPEIYRLSTWIPGITEHGFTFNQFLLTGDEPFLFHTGHRFLFPQVSAAVEQILPLTQLRWISFGHLEADECGAVNQFLAVAPDAEVIHGQLAVMLSLTDMCDRPPVTVGGARPRHRRASPSVHHHTSCATQLGSRAVVRRDHLDAARRSPVHPHRALPGPHRVRVCRTGIGG